MVTWYVCTNHVTPISLPSKITKSALWCGHKLQKKVKLHCARAYTWTYLEYRNGAKIDGPELKMDEPDFLMGSRGGFSNSDPVFCQGLNLIQIGTESDQSKLWSANHVYPLGVTHILESENSWKVQLFSCFWKGYWVDSSGQKYHFYVKWSNMPEQKTSKIKIFKSKISIFFYFWVNYFFHT